MKSSSNQVFIQSRNQDNTSQRPSQVNNFMNGTRLSQILNPLEEIDDTDENLVQQKREFPQSFVKPQIQHQQYELETEVLQEPQQQKKKMCSSKFQIFQQKSLMKQPTIFRKAAEEQEDNNEEDKEDINKIPKDLNLKYGDIIYFKYYREQSKGILSGDGIAGNKLECISIGSIIGSGSEEHFKNEYEQWEIEEKSFDANNNEYPSDEVQSKQILNKRASLQFRKCLFRVTNSKKYYYQNLYNQELKQIKQNMGSRNKNQQQQKLSDIENNMREEQEENIRGYHQKLGQNVIYGQEIQLEHLYSKCVLTLNPDVLAYEHCCREVITQILFMFLLIKDRMWQYNQNGQFYTKFYFKYAISQLFIKLKLSLEENPSKWSNFIVNSANNAKKTGEPVLYKEQLCIYSSENPYYWVNIQQIKETYKQQQDDQDFVQNLFDEGLEVNCTDRSVPLKLCSYLSITQEQEREKLKIEETESQNISVGDIVYIYNRQLTKKYTLTHIKFIKQKIVKGRIGVARKSLNNPNESSQFQMKDVKIQLETVDDFQQKKSLPINVIKVEDYTKNISKQYELFIDDNEEDERIESLWEIQRVKNFDASIPQYDEQIRIKNVWTGLYLQLNENDQLSLTLEGNLDKTFFQIRPKKVVQLLQSNIQYQVPVKIFQQLHDKNVFLRTKEDPYEEEEWDIKEKNNRSKLMSGSMQRSRKISNSIVDKDKIARPVTSISSSQIKKDKRGEIEFEFIKADDKLKLLADRVSSLFPYLMNFYVFLLQWGNEIRKDNNGEIWKYDYIEAFKDQKSLYNYVQQLYQSIENLNDFLKHDSQLKQRQKILLYSGIVEIILLILKLIHYKIYCHCEQETNPKEQKIIDYQTIPDKTPQKIASIKLLKCISVLYDLLEKCIQGNSETSSFVLRMQQDNFLFNQLKFHKTEVVQLLKEATRYVDADQKDQNIANMKKWVDQIQQINIGNVVEQTFIIELLCLSITDHLEQPIVVYQDALRKLLFRRPRKNKDEDDNFKEKNMDGRENKYTGQLQKPILLSFKTEKDQPYIIFNVSFKPKFENENQELYLTGKKGQEFIRDIQNVNHFPFDHVNGTMAKSKNQTIVSQNLEKYESYVLEVLNMYALLSAGRNQKSIKCLSSIGLTKDYIMKCLQSKRIDNNHLRQYRSMLNLYDSFILNVPPFIPISKYNNLVFLKDDFNEFVPQTQASYALFRDIVVNQETKTQIREDYQNMNDKGGQETNENKLLFLYAEQLVNKEKLASSIDPKNNQDSKQQPSALSSLKIQDELINYGEDKDKIIPKLNHEDPIYSSHTIVKPKLSKFMMETFHQMLKLIKTRVNLGYNTPEENQRILNIIPNLFFALIDFKDQSRVENDQSVAVAADDSEEKQDNKTLYKNYNKNWIYKFMLYNLEYCMDDLITTKIFIEAVTIVNIINKLNMYLYIVQTIKSKEVNFGVDSLMYFYQFRFSLEDLKQLSESKHVNLCVLIMQTMEYLRRDPTLESTMFKTLLTNFDYLKDLQNQMIEVEIIEDPHELDLYREVNGISENQNYKSPEDIKQLVTKTLQYFQYYKKLVEEEDFFSTKPQKNDEEATRIYDQKQMKFNDLEKNFDQLSSAIDSCNSLLNQKRFNQRESSGRIKQHYLFQLQNIFRHSQIPEYFIILLQNVPQFNSSFIEFYRKIVVFFELYTKDNLTNKRRILTLITDIMNLCLIPNDNILNADKNIENNLKKIPPIKISNLCIQLLEDIKTEPVLIKDIINNIINLIEINVPFDFEAESGKGQTWKQMKYKIYRYGVQELKCLALIQYLKILKSLTYQQNGPSIQSNQLQILNNFMHRKILSDIVQPIIESYLSKFDIKFNNLNELLKLKLHTQGIILLSQCCKDFKLGIQEIQRFVMFDTLKAIVVSQHAPFLLKRAYLKCLFEAYVNKIYDLEKDGANETISNIELNDILSSEVIPILRLTTSYRYLEGLISGKDHQKEQESLDNLRANIKRRKYNHFKGNPSYDSAIWAESHRKDETDEQKKQYQGVVHDCSEYWKYIFKEGIIHFVIDSYDEFTDVINNNINESDHSGSVKSNYKIIGYALQELSQQIEIAEKEFKILIQDSYVDYDLIKASLEVIPIGNPKTSGKNIYIKGDKKSKQQITVMSKNNHEQQQEPKVQKELSLNNDPEDNEYFEIQKQFKLQLMRKRIQIKEFLQQLMEEFMETKQIHRSLYNTLNAQKIIYTPSQVSYILKKLFKLDQKSGIASPKKENYFIKNKKRQNSHFVDQEQIKKIIKGIFELGSKNKRNEVGGELSTEFINSLFRNQKLRSQQAQIDKVKIMFGKQIRSNIRDELNIVKKSILDSKVEDDIKNEKQTNISVKDKYSGDIDNCIADYEQYNQGDQDELLNQPQQQQQDTIEMNKSPSQKPPNVDSIINQVDEEEEPELGLIEKTYQERLMIDSQITMFLKDIQRELNIYGTDQTNDNESDDDDDHEEESEAGFTYQASHEEDHQNQKFSSYLSLFSSVFNGQRYYFVKIIRLIMELVQIDDKTMIQLTSTKLKERKRAKAKFDLLQLCQKEVAKKELFVHALKFIKVSSTYDEIQEGLTFMICMLNRGNQEAQNALLAYFKRDTDALVDFFSFLRNFFNQEISHQIKFMSDQQVNLYFQQLCFLLSLNFINKPLFYLLQKHVTQIPTQFEILSLKILRLIQLLCENVNENFQLFLMQQSENDSSHLSNYNLTLEVSTFLSIFLEDETLQMNKKQNIIVQCIDTLNECISGQKIVLQCVARNKRLFTYLNERIIRNKQMYIKPANLQNYSPEDRQVHEDNLQTITKNLELFQSALKFILTIVSGIPNKDELESLFDQIQTDQLIKILNMIYKYRIQPKKSQILMDQHCSHIGRKDKLYICNEDYCQFGNVSALDNLIISIGFNIFILFYYLREIFPNSKEKLYSFHLDEKKDLEFTMINLDLGSNKKKQQVIEKINKQQTNEQFKLIPDHSISKEDQEEDNKLQEDDQNISKKDSNSMQDKEKMSARQLLNMGLGHIILKDIAQFDKGEAESGGMMQVIKNQIKLLNIDDYKIEDEILRDKNQLYFHFFKNFIGSVEVKNQHGDLQKVYFQKPFYTKFLTIDIKKHLIYKADRDSNTERLMFLIDHTNFYEDQMIWKQSISKWGFFSYIADKWRLYKELSYLLVVALTLITLITYGNDSSKKEESGGVADSSNNENISRTFQIVSYIQLVLSFAILVSCAIERYPITTNRHVQSHMYDIIQKFKRNSGFPDDKFKSIYNLLSNTIYSFFSPSNAKSKLHVKVLLVCLDFENIYNLAYLIITGFALYNNFIYAFLLLDIVKRSEDLQNVISSITKNALNLLKFAFLGLVIMYIYGIIGYQAFRDNYDAKSGGISDTFILTITSTIKEGLRRGGGVADSMEAVLYSDDNLWSRYFFDLTFFIVINMLFIQIIFGIILDTFGELRDNRQELLQSVKETCYICGLSRRFVEANSDKDWHHHIYMEHNCYNLLFYMIYLQRKSENDCDALEKYIKRCLEKESQKRVDFIPIETSLQIELFRKKEKEHEQYQDEEKQE